MKIMQRIACGLLGIVCLCRAGFAEGVYQFATEFEGSAGKTNTAYLWVPPDADRIRGVLVGGRTLMEEYFAADPAVRRACQAQKLAIVYCVPHFNCEFNYVSNNCGQVMEGMLRRLGEVSGYSELAVAPIMPYGHSVSSIYAKNAAYWNPARCFGVIFQKGGGPGGPPAGDPAKSLLGIPMLVLKGQFEEFGPGPSGVLRDFETRETGWRGMRGSIVQRRRQDDRYLVSILVDPGASHMAWPPDAGPVVGLFIRKAAERRIPEWSADATHSPVLLDIDPKTGALTRDDLENPDGYPAASYPGFKGSPTNSPWHLDLELARAVDEFHRPIHRPNPQYVAFADEKGNPIPPGHDLRLRLNPKWVGADLFKVAGAFHRKPPTKYPSIDGEAGHADTPILFRPFSGALEQTEPGLFRIGFDPRGNTRPAILAYHPGDATYRPAEQPAFVNGPKLDAGRKQVITFEPVGNLKVDGKPIQLKASSDSGLPVRFAVEYGPAVTEGDLLRVTEMPARARFPVTVVVCAYQAGSTVDPVVQAAVPVRQNLRVER